MIKKVVIAIKAVALLSICSFSLYAQHKIAIIGTGYVGLVTGAGLAELGHHVYCVDIDAAKINHLQHGIIPIYEPGLNELIQKNTNKGSLHFSTNISQAIQNSDIIFIAVGTPSLPDGNVDLAAIKAITNTIKDTIHGHKIICMKSTVPIGTCNQIAEMINSCNKDAVVLSNPEFLREGFAVYDFFNPMRIVVGSNFIEQAEIMRDIYAPLLEKNVPILFTDLVSSETIKYASNAFLAIKIAYINEIAQLSSKLGANINAITVGMGLDDRIGNKFLKPGPGYGGSCLPKDTIALVKKAEENGINLRTIAASIEANREQKMFIVQKTTELCDDDLKGKRITIWGLAFKANTDDVRESAAIDIINEFLNRGAQIKAYDPLANENMKRIIPNIFYCNTKEQALETSDALIILTEWDEFKDFDYSQIDKYMHTPVIIDTRNVVPMALKKNMNTVYRLGY